MVDAHLLAEIKLHLNRVQVGLDKLSEGVAKLATEVRECKQELAEALVATKRSEPVLLRMPAPAVHRESPDIRRVSWAGELQRGRYWPTAWPHWMANQPPRYLGRVALTPAGPVTTRLTHLG